MSRGFFITFEGGEGAGKSTQIKRLAKTLAAKGFDVVVTREPGGSPGAEALRHVILSGTAEPFGPRMEAMLFAAARADHIDQLIRPALSEGKVVLCDRFIDSSRVYQGGVDVQTSAFVRQLERITVADMLPDLTLIFDVDPKTGLKRATRRRGKGVADRFEKEALQTHQLRRAAFLDIARAEPQRCVVIDASARLENVEKIVTRAVLAVLERRANEF